MTFQDKRKVGLDWDKVKIKRNLMHPKNTIEANGPNGVITETKPKADKK
nr:hypothetical protein [uncultured Pedobacter sp.]